MKIYFYIFYATLFLTFLSVYSQKNLEVQDIQDILPKLDILLVGTNDIHGSAFPTLITRKDTGANFQYGGLVYMANIIQTLRSQYDNRLLYLDAGDQFQGGFQASKTISSGQIVSDYLNHSKTNANAVGNHQFDFGPQFLDNYLSKLNSDITNSNLIDNSTGQLPLRNQKRSNIYKFQIKQRSPFIDPEFKEIKIGVIGLSTLETPRTTSGFTQKLFPQTYQFLDYKAIVQRQSQNLKSNGAHAIILVSHVGNDCDKRSQYGLWTIKNQPTSLPCEKGDQIFKLIDSLKDGTIDAVVQGHRHTQSHYFHKGIPIIGTINGGFYMHTIRLRFTLSGMSAYLNDDDLLIQGPIPICAKIFQGTRKCQFVPPEKLPSAGQLVQWSFHGKTVQADTQLNVIFQSKYAQKMKPYLYKIADNYIPYPLTKDYLADSALGNLIINAMANSIKRRFQDNIDFVVINPGGLRTTWYPGLIRYAQQFSMFPFDNRVVSFKILGLHLKRMVQILQNGEKRYYPTWGLQQIFVRNPQVKRPLKNIRRIHLLSEKQVLQEQMSLTLLQLISTLDKKQIQDQKIYKGVTLNFCLDGGDDFSDVVNKPQQIRIFQISDYNIQLRDLIQFQLQFMKQIEQKYLEGPNNMTRIIIKDQINQPSLTILS